MSLEEREAEAKPTFCVMLSNTNNWVTYNLTPWLREAPETEIRDAIFALFGKMDQNPEVLLKAAERCRRHADGEHDSPKHLGVAISLNRHDEARLMAVLREVRPETADAAQRILRFARTSRKLEFDRMWADYREAA